jgi:hypothetical protein
MPFTFYGNWAPMIVTTGVTYIERARIAGSIASDGPLTGPVYETLAPINGAVWQVYMEYSTDGGTSWLESPTIRTPDVTPADGLIISLSAFYNAAEKLVEGFIAQFTYLNREVNPLGPSEPPYGFTLPSGSFRPAPQSIGNPYACPCTCMCTCRPAVRQRLKCAPRPGVGRQSATS